MKCNDFRDGFSELGDITAIVWHIWFKGLHIGAKG